MQDQRLAPGQQLLTILASSRDFLTLAIDGSCSGLVSLPCNYLDTSIHNSASPGPAQYCRLQVLLEYSGCCEKPS
jgi:hypothetical protein